MRTMTKPIVILSIGILFLFIAILPVAASREWITGISIRGYVPVCDPEDKSSSISCKPAQDVIQYWYTGLTNGW